MDDSRPPLWFFFISVLALLAPPWAGYRLSGGYEAGFSWPVFASWAAGAVVFMFAAIAVRLALFRNGLRKAGVIWGILTVLVYLAGSYAIWTFYTAPQLVRLFTTHDHFALSFWEDFKLDMSPFLSMTAGMYLLILGFIAFIASKPLKRGQEQEN